MTMLNQHKEGHRFHLDRQVMVHDANGPKREMCKSREEHDEVQLGREQEQRKIAREKT